MRTISAFEVSHLASANCTAIARILTVLSQNSSETQSRSPELERVAPGTSDATVGVVNLGSGGLEIHHTSRLAKHETEEILRRLPLDPSRDSQADSVSRALDNAPSGMKVELAQNLCNNLSFGRDSRAVRAYPIQGKPSGWMAFIYDPFTLDELSAKVADLIRTPGLAWRGRLDVLYQSAPGLHAAMPRFTGDWYFTGEYPTPGGYKVLNTAFLNWRRGDERRAY